MLKYKQFYSSKNIQHLIDEVVKCNHCNLECTLSYEHIYFNPTTPHVIRQVKVDKYHFSAILINKILINLNNMDQYQLYSIEPLIR